MSQRQQQQQNQQHQQQQNQNHVRANSQCRRTLPPHARSVRPAPVRRGHSYNHSHGHHQQSQHQAHTSVKAPLPLPSKKVVAVEVGEDQFEEESDMASFLQFCATCEKQIVTPGASILYCSESCRLKDVSRSPSAQSIEAVRSPSISTPFFFDHPLADIVPKRSPTVLQPVSFSLSDLTLDDSNSRGESVDSFARRDSDLNPYLEQFYSDLAPSRRPHHSSRQNSTATDSSNIPSLVHSPSSSYETDASVADFYHHNKNKKQNNHYQQQPRRPTLPARHDPFTTTTKSIDLVIPYYQPTTLPSSPASLKSTASTLTSYRIAQPGELSFDGQRSDKTISSRTPEGEREPEELSHEYSSSRSTTTKARNEAHRNSIVNAGAADRALKQLFCHDAIKAPPTMKR